MSALTEEEAERVRGLWRDIGDPPAEIAFMEGLPLAAVEAALGPAAAAGKPVIRVVDPGYLAELDRSLGRPRPAPAPEVLERVYAWLAARG